MNKDWNPLIVSGLVSKRTLLQISSALPIHLCRATTMGQTQEWSTRQGIGAVSRKNGSVASGKNHE